MAEPNTSPNSNPETNPEGEGLLDELNLDELNGSEGEEEERDEAPSSPPAVSATSLQWQPWPLVMNIGAVVIAVLALLTAGLALQPSGELNDFRKEIVQTVDGKIASASKTIIAEANATIVAASEVLQTIGQQQIKMANDITSIANKQVGMEINVAKLDQRVDGVESEMDKYKKSIDRYNSAMKAIAEQSTRAIALARAALATEEVQVFITKANFLFNHSDLLPAMKAELEQVGFRNGTKQIIAVFGTADQGRSDERNRTLVRERSLAGADWIGSAANAKGGEYPAVVDPFDGANCRKLVIVYRLAPATASAPQ